MWRRSISWWASTNQWQPPFQTQKGSKPGHQQLLTLRNKLEASTYIFVCFLSSFVLIKVLFRSGLWRVCVHLRVSRVSFAETEIRISMGHCCSFVHRSGLSRGVASNNETQREFRYLFFKLFLLHSDHFTGPEYRACNIERWLGWRANCNSGFSFLRSSLCWSSN